MQLDRDDESNPIDVLHYDLHLLILPEEKQITARADLEIRSLPSAESTFFLHLLNLTVDSVFINGSKTSEYLYGNGKLVMDTPAMDDTFGVSVYYHGTPGNDRSGGFFFIKDIIYTHGEGLNTQPPSMLRFWVPSHDVPDDKATLDMYITVPTGLSAFSNGLLVDTTTSEEGTTTWHWQEKHPIASYLIALAVSNYEVHQEPYVSIDQDTIPLEFYVTPEKFENAELSWQNLSQMMRVFEELLGPYPFDRYSMAETYQSGAMEHQTMTSMSTNLITGDHKYDYIVAHELAHHWFGDYVTLTDWREIWLNEGFASYCEALYFEQIAGQDSLRGTMQTMATNYFSEVGRIGHFALYDPVYMWGYTVYQKGAWVLHMLRYLVGDDAFINTLRNYLDQHAYGNATIDDFQRIAEQESGQDLDLFFEQWIYRPGYPDLEVGWETSLAADGKRLVELFVRQRQVVGGIFEFPLEVMFRSDNSSLLDTLSITQDYETFQWELDFNPSELDIDPYEWLLDKTKIVARPLPPGFEDYEFGLSQTYPNPFVPSGEVPATRIDVQVAQKDNPHHIQLTVYNTLGKRVKTIANHRVMGGLYTYSWDASDENGTRVPDGVYFVRFKSGSTVLYKKLTVLSD